MLNFSNRNYRSSLFSIALIPFVVTSGGIGSTDAIDVINNAESKQIVAQNTFAGWVASFWQRRPSRPLAARTGGICPIAPGLVETYTVWHERPLFLWQNPGNNEDVQLIVRDYDNQSVVWEQKVKTADEKILYNNQQPLESGKLYQWKLLGNTSSTNWITFQVMPDSDRAQIQAHLQTLEQKLRATRASHEEIALTKADYFRNYQIKHKTDNNIIHLWS
ncbi:MAG TPA: hypothetical protein DEV81_16060, partial [Cyanobacteria bacterium UBA11049]|nr:hypothetical protein [Cyanobacteria bacterium UBA11049]